MTNGVFLAAGTINLHQDRQGNGGGAADPGIAMDQQVDWQDERLVNQVAADLEDLLDIFTGGRGAILRTLFNIVKPKGVMIAVIDPARRGWSVVWVTVYR